MWCVGSPAAGALACASDDDGLRAGSYVSRNPRIFVREGEWMQKCREHSALCRCTQQASRRIIRRRRLLRPGHRRYRERACDFFAM